MIQKVPRFVFGGDGDPELIDEFNRFLIEYPKVVPCTVSEPNNTVIQEIVTSTINHFEGIGLDISERIAQKERICCLSENDFCSFALELQYDPEVTHAFFSSNYFKVFYTPTVRGEAKELYRLARTILHEIVHSCIHYKVIIKRETMTFVLGQTSFCPLRESLFLESFVDITVCEIIKYQWWGNRILKEFAQQSFGEIAYDRGAVLLDAVIERVSTLSNRPYRSILQGLQRDFALGTSHELDIIAEHLPKGVFEKFLMMKLNSDDEIIARFAEDIGVEKIAIWLRHFKHSVPYYGLKSI